jgi:hypothetical protein
MFARMVKYQLVGLRMSHTGVVHLPVLFADAGRVVGYQRSIEAVERAGGDAPAICASGCVRGW